MANGTCGNTKPAFSQGDRYKQAYWKFRNLHLYVRFTAKSDSQFQYIIPVFLQFKISFSLIRAYFLMTITNKPIRKLEV